MRRKIKADLFERIPNLATLRPRRGSLVFPGAMSLVSHDYPAATATTARTERIESRHTLQAPPRKATLSRPRVQSADACFDKERKVNNRKSSHDEKHNDKPVARSSPVGLLAQLSFSNVFSAVRKASKSFTLNELPAQGDSSRTRKSISNAPSGGVSAAHIELVGCIPHDLFEAARQQIYMLMSRDCYARYLSEKRKEERLKNRKQLSKALDRIHL